MIREMTKDDLKALCPILQNEVRLRMNYPDEQLNEEFFLNLWGNAMDSGTSLSFVVEDDGNISGFLFGMVGPDLYSGLPTGYETFWYMRERNGLSGSRNAMRLLKAFTQKSKDLGCVRVMTGMWSTGPDLSKMYERLGYHKLETHFKKELK